MRIGLCRRLAVLWSGRVAEVSAEDAVLRVGGDDFFSDQPREHAIALSDRSLRGDVRCNEILEPITHANARPSDLRSNAIPAYPTALGGRVPSSVLLRRLLDISGAREGFLKRDPADPGKTTVPALRYAVDDFGRVVGARQLHQSSVYQT